MRLRQTKTRELLTRSRVVSPGEVDHEIGFEQLSVLAPPTWSSALLAACESLYGRWIEPATGGCIPDAVFCDLSRWVFLEYLVRFHDVLLWGSNEPDVTSLQPAVLSRNLAGWNAPRHFAFANSLDAIFRAVLDQRRLRALDCPVKSTLTWQFAGGTKSSQWGYYFGIDFRALPFAPWRAGTVYVYRRADFPSDYDTMPCLTDRAVAPVARLTVYPWDFPFLDRVEGVDVAAQIERQCETFRGYPWVDDCAIHPNRWQRSIVAEARTHIETNLDAPAPLALLGRRAGLSPYALLRTFQAAVGMSPLTYQTLLRVNRVKQLLRDSTSIAHAAVATGFCDQTHLSRHFRRIVGMTPGQYIRAQESPI